MNSKDIVPMGTLGKQLKILLIYSRDEMMLRMQ